MLRDKQLAGNASRGDQSALATLYDRHSTLLYSVALRITGDAASAADLLEDAFVRLWHNASQFETAQGSPLGWMLAMIPIAPALAPGTIAVPRPWNPPPKIWSNRRTRAAPRCSTNISPTMWFPSRSTPCQPISARPSSSRTSMDDPAKKSPAGRDAPVASAKASMRIVVRSMKNRLFDADASASALDDIVITHNLSARRRRPRAPKLEPKCLDSSLMPARRHPRS